MQKEISYKTLGKTLGLLLGLSSFAFAPNAFAVVITTSTDNNATLGAIPGTTNATNSLNSFIPSTSINTLDFESVATGSNATFNGSGTLTTINGITFSTTANLTGGNPVNGKTNTTSTGPAVGFGTTGGYQTGTFLRLDPLDNNTFTLNFAVPVSRFGFIITDFGNTPTPNNNAISNTISYTFNSGALPITQAGQPHTFLNKEGHISQQ
jgi:hypothetical protein